jgi:hypothetical protein
MHRRMLSLQLKITLVMTTLITCHYLLHQMLCLPHPKLLKLIVQLILDSLVKIKQKNLDKFLTLVSWLKRLR